MHREGEMFRLLTIILVISFAPASFAQEAKTIKQEDTFIDMIVGKKWTHAWGKTWVKVNKDGTVIGDSPNGKIKGTWYWKQSAFSDKRWCRTVTVGSQELKEECQKFQTIGDRIMVNTTSSAPKGNYYFTK